MLLLDVFFPVIFWRRPAGFRRYAVFRSLIALAYMSSLHSVYTRCFAEPDHRSSLNRWRSLGLARKRLKRWMTNQEASIPLALFSPAAWPIQTTALLASACTAVFGTIKGTVLGSVRNGALRHLYMFLFIMQSFRVEKDHLNLVKEEQLRVSCWSLQLKSMLRE